MRRPAARRSLGVSRGFFFPVPPPSFYIYNKVYASAAVPHVQGEARLPFLRRQCGHILPARIPRSPPHVRSAAMRTCGAGCSGRADSSIPHVRNARVLPCGSCICLPAGHGAPHVRAMARHISAPLPLPVPRAGRRGGMGRLLPLWDFFPGMAKKTVKYLEVPGKPLTLLPMIFFL